MGFYEREANPHRRRELRVRVSRPGLRALHASGYAFREREDKRASQIEAAFMSPESFTGGVVRAHLFPLRPDSPRSWDCLLVVDFPVTLPAAGDAWVEREFGAVLARESEAVHTLDRRISLRAREPAGAQTRRVSFVEHVLLEPGPYTLTSVMTDDGASAPFARKVRVDLPDIPRKEPFLVGPLLGRRASENVVVIGEAPPEDGRASGAEPADRIGSPASFEPLIVRRAEADEPLIALTQVCRVKGGPPAGAHVVRRVLVGPDGTAVGSLRPVALELEDRGPVRCQSVVDVLPTGSLEPGPYVFRTVLDTERSPRQDEAEVPFAVARPGPSPEAETASLR